MLYDALLVVALIAVVNALALGIVVRVTAGEQQVLNSHLVQLLTALSIVGFFSVFWLNGGQRQIHPESPRLLRFQRFSKSMRSSS